MIEAFNVLTDRLTIDLKLDVRQLIRDLIASDIVRGAQCAQQRGGFATAEVVDLEIEAKLLGCPDSELAIAE